jgi:hypothetical protein
MKQMSLKSISTNDLMHAARRQEKRDAARRRTDRQLQNEPSGKSTYHLEELRRLMGWTPAAAEARMIERVTEERGR